MGQNAWNCAGGEQSEMRNTWPGSIPCWYSGSDWLHWGWDTELQILPCQPWISGVTPLDLLALLCLMQPRIPLPLTTRVCCQLMPNLVFSSTHRSFSIKLLSHWGVSSRSWCLHFFLTRCRIWHFSLLNSVGFLLTHSCCPLRSLWMDAHPSGTPAMPSSLANLLRVHPAPSSQLLMRVLHRAGLLVWPLGCNYWLLPSMPLVLATQPGLKPNHRLRIQYLKQQLLYEDLKWECVKGLPEVQADNVHCQSRQTMSISNALETRLAVLGVTFQKSDSELTHTSCGLREFQCYGDIGNCVKTSTTRSAQQKTKWKKLQSELTFCQGNCITVIMHIYL